MNTPTHHICLMTGKTEPLSRLIRFAITPDNQLVPDLAGKLPEPALWITGERALIRRAIAEDAFSQAAGQQVQIADDLLTQLERLLEAQVGGLLGLARRAGAVKLGFTATESCLRKRTAELVVVAREAALDGRRKITQLAKRQRVAVINNLSAARLRVAFGRENVVYAVIIVAHWAARIGAWAARLTLFRADRGMVENKVVMQ